MITNEMRNSLKQALAELNIVGCELKRPVEVVLSPSVCLNARESMNTMLRLFLLCKEMNPTEGNSLNDLFNQCKALEKQFANINMSTVLCNEMNHSDCDKKYCLSTEKINDCFSIANQFKTIVLNILKINESEMN